MTDIGTFTTRYEQMTNDELMRVSAERELLVANAVTAIDTELARRGLSVATAKPETKRTMPWFSLRGARSETESENGSELLVRVSLFVWVVLLLPWVLFAFLSPMAFDGGKAWAAWLFMFFTWSYAPAVYGAFKLLTYSRKAVLLPLLSIGGMFLSDFLAR